MNPVATSKDAVLQVSRQLIQEQGWSSISIRAVASACGVSVGTIYNYFPSKSALVSATIESVWCDIFHSAEKEAHLQDILSCITWFYQRMAYGRSRYPGFFSLHSAGFMQVEKEDAKQLMEKTCQHILDGLCAVVKADPQIRPDAFDDDFTPEKFSEMLFSLLLTALMKQEDDPTALCVMVRRTLY